MNSPPFTLIDVMRGIKKHRLADKLDDGVYKFLIELILEANELGFKNPIDLTVNQALAIGGGKSRQSLYNRRNALKKIMLNGKHLVKVSVGSYGRRSLAAYEIDYELLCSYNGVWCGVRRQSSNVIDDSLTIPLRSLDASRYDTLPILRSEENKEDQQKTQISPLDALPSDDTSTGIDEAPASEKTMELGMFMGAVEHKYGGRMQISDAAALKILRQHPAGGYNFWKWVLDRMPDWDNLTIRHANGIQGYGDKLWVQYKRANNIQVFF